MFSQALEQMVQSTAPAVVAVEHRRGQGSGVVLNDKGNILTNRHVVARSDGRVLVRFSDGTETSARVVGTDSRTDIAVLQSDAFTAPALKLGDSKALRVGSVVIAIGNPLRFEQSVSLGVVSALERSLPAGHHDVLEGLIQTDAAINPGNSGGPLLDASGTIVGINTAILPYAQGIGFAVPAHTAEWVANALLQRGVIDRPYFGIVARAEQLQPALAKQYSQPRAIRVIGTARGGAAQSAGLREGDLLLTLEKTPLSSVDDLQRVSVLSANTTLELVYARDGATHTVAVQPQRPRNAYAA
jgi:S1-C subfamily serine protease